MVETTVKTDLTESVKLLASYKELIGESRRHFNEENFEFEKKAIQEIFTLSDKVINVFKDLPPQDDFWLTKEWTEGKQELLRFRRGLISMHKKMTQGIVRVGLRKEFAQQLSERIDALTMILLRSGHHSKQLEQFAIDKLKNVRVSNAQKSEIVSLVQDWRPLLNAVENKKTDISSVLRIQEIGELIKKIRSQTK